MYKNIVQEDCTRGRGGKVLKCLSVITSVINGVLARVRQRVIAYKS